MYAVRVCRVNHGTEQQKAYLCSTLEIQNHYCPICGEELILINIDEILQRK